MKKKYIEINQKQNRISKLLAYGKKTFELGRFFSLFNERRANKQKNDAYMIIIFLLSFACKKNSMRAIEEFSGELGYYTNRSVLESFLKVEGLPRKLRRQLKAMVRAMQRGKMLTLPNVKGRKLGAVDGVEIYRKAYTPEEFCTAVENKKICNLCCVSVHRDSNTKEIVRYECFHRVLVLSIVTNRGPIPIDWEFQTSTAGDEYLIWLNNGAKPNEHPKEECSEQEVKQTGELTAMQELMTRLNLDYNGFLPFNTIVADSLYDKANIIDLLEKYNVALIAGHKDKRRTLRIQAESDFKEKAPKIWSHDHINYEGYFGVYEDVNRAKSNSNKVRIVHVVRDEPGEQTVYNYFYCSNFSWMTPQFVEWCRYYRWKLENGFNVWANKWEILKHMFHHHAIACNSIIGIFFITVIWVNNFWKGNLNRGIQGIKAIKETYENFFDSLRHGIKKILEQGKFGFIYKLINST